MTERSTWLRFREIQVEQSPWRALCGRLRQWLFAERDSSALAVFRILFGAVMFVSLVRPLAYGWVKDFYVVPRFAFKYWGFEWVRLPDPGFAYTLHYGLAFLALCISVGFQYRLAILGFFLGFSYLQLLDVSNYLNHYYLVVLLSFLMVFMPLESRWSVDAWRKPVLRAERLPALYTFLLRFQVALVYLSAGLAKFTEDWLLHAQPLGIWLSARTDTPVLGAWFAEPWAAYAMSWAGFLFDSLVVLFLSFRATRVWAFGAVILFHALTKLLFPIGMFPFIMVMGALVFFPPDFPQKVLKVLAAWRKTASSPEPSHSPARACAWTWHTPLGLAAAAAYCLFQLVMPLRHYLHPGSVLWNEQGMRFGWKVMVREKNGSATFYVRDPQSGSLQQVSPRQYLTRHQEREMASQPDLILQLAQRIAQDFRRQDRGDPQVFAEVWVSLNGRKPTLLLDPTVDLARVTDGLGSAPWILPEPSDVPIQLALQR